MSLTIKRFINSPVPSNTYLMYIEGEEDCVIIDPGTHEEEDLISFIDKKKLKPSYILLTHEHFDHIWGCNMLKKRYGCRIVCSEVCAQKIAIPQNYYNKLYNDSDEFYSISSVYDTVEHLNLCLNIGWIVFKFIKTPGHSSSSICIEMDGLLFTGDTIMNGYKPIILKRHEGSKELFKESVCSIFEKFSKDTLIYPGHGEVFKLYEAKLFYEKYFSKL